MVDSCTQFFSSLLIIAVAHIAGKKLSKFQYRVIIAIYSAFSLFVIAGCVSISSRFIDFAYATRDTDLTIVLYAAATVLVACWFASIAFMVNVRMRDDT